VTAAGPNHFPMWILSLFEVPLPKDFRDALKFFRSKIPSQK
jgi:hypothetical protein